MSNVKLWFSTAAVMLLIATSWTVPALTQSGGATGGSGTIQGTVKAADGAPMEGVIVSARASHETFTTSVYTDRQGNYSFPLQSAGQYAMWAQAKGFDVAKADFSLANGGRVDRNLTLRPLTDPKVIARQLDGPEWFAALPEANDQDRRMKHLLRNNCTACHGPAFTLAPRFDARGWENIIDVMARGIPPTRPPAAATRCGRRTSRSSPNISAASPRTCSRSPGRARRASPPEWCSPSTTSRARAGRSRRTPAPSGRKASQRATRARARVISGSTAKATSGCPTTAAWAAPPAGWIRGPASGPTIAAEREGHRHELARDLGRPERQHLSGRAAGRRHPDVRHEERRVRSLRPARQHPESGRAHRRGLAGQRVEPGRWRRGETGREDRRVHVLPGALRRWRPAEQPESIWDRRRCAGQRLARAGGIGKRGISRPEDRQERPCQVRAHGVPRV